MKNAMILYLVASGLASCSTGPQETVHQMPLRLEKELDTTKLLTTIALGSCNRQDLPQVYWDSIKVQDPDLWIWLGDNIYGDTEDMLVLEAKYRQQKTNEHYSAFISQIPVIGIWDDHDYGVNDGDQHYPFKKASKELMLDFLDVGTDATVRKREGAYQSFSFGPSGKKVKIILLDARYFRDTLQGTGMRSGPRYLPNETGDILGEVQWKWLENELRQSDAQVHLIGCGIQMIPEEQGFEKWANFPQARNRLLALISEIDPPGLLLMSGDRHIAELSKWPFAEGEKNIYELTASGLTHTWSGLLVEESNRYRVGDLLVSKNYGVIRINWDFSPPRLSVAVSSTDNEILLREELP